jgi:hypothetical protein
MPNITPNHAFISNLQASYSCFHMRSSLLAIVTIIAGSSLAAGHLIPNVVENQTFNPRGVTATVANLALLNLSETGTLEERRFIVRDPNVPKAVKLAFASDPDEQVQMSVAQIFDRYYYDEPTLLRLAHSPFVNVRAYVASRAYSKEALIKVLKQDESP